ncbi:MAG: Do family serine endopeptidase [Deltaproteobacteria bacterium]|nr:MAG: Do family serine endopeptidase [Deltaproteobacteria bacterium]
MKKVDLSRRIVSSLASGLLLAGCASAHAGTAVQRTEAARAAPKVAAARTDRAREGPEAKAARIAVERGGAARLTPLEQAFHDAAEKVRPSVVSIATVRRIDPRKMGPMLPFGLPFGMPEGELEQRGLGSGVILDAAGHILTNNHVVAGADELEVHLADDRVLVAEVVGTDPKTDLAVIRVEAEDLVPATFGDSKSLQVGQWVLAVGSPFGLEQTVSAGIVSAVGRGSVGIVDYGDFIQTDAAINPGNSGGPLVDLSGRVVGINTAIASRTGGSNGVGFAIPTHMATDIAQRLVADGHIVRGWLGVFIADLTPDMAATFGLSRDEGVLVQDVLPDGPASKSKLEAGDIVVELDGRKVEDAATFRREIAALPPGHEARLTVVRDGKRKTITVTLGELPDEGPVADARPGRRKEGPGKRARKYESQGLTLRDLPAEVRKRAGLEGGALIVKVEPGSRAARAGLRPRDVLLAVGGTKVRSARQAHDLLESAADDRPVRVRIRRGDARLFVALPAARD